MLNIKVTGRRQAFKRIDKSIEQLIERVADDVLVVARANTPILTGRARRGWKKQRMNKDISVFNRVPYIDRLEKGSSRQAPSGITGPTLQTILARRYYRGRFK